MTMASDPTFCARPYLVGVIDLLGQTDKLRELDAFSLDGEAHQDCREQLVRIANEVTRVRNKFDGSVQSRENDLLKRARELDVALVDGMSREELLTTLGFTLYRNYFSDMLVLHSPMDGGLMRLGPRVVVLEDLAGAMLWSLACRVPMRGGVEIGYAVEMPQHDVYGYPAFRAYKLESEVADYPRIVIGENLVKHIDDWDVTKGERTGRISSKDARELDFSTWCRNFFCKDEDDGMTMLDFLGEGVRNQVPAAVPLFKKALNFVESERQRFLEERNIKLANRYSRLLLLCMEHAFG
jgi:hypothetical protein